MVDEFHFGGIWSLSAFCRSDLLTHSGPHPESVGWAHPLIECGLAAERLKSSAFGDIRSIAQALFPFFFVDLVVAFAPNNAAIAFEGQDVSCDAVKEPAIMTHDDGTATEGRKTFFKSS